MAAAYIDTFIRYSDRNAEGGFIRANGDYSFTMSDHPARVHNARLESIDFATHGFKLVKHATDVDFANPEEVQQRWYPGCLPARQGTDGRPRGVRVHGHPAGRR